MINTKRLLKILISLLFTFSLVSCATAPIPTTYTVYLTRHFEKTKEAKDPTLTAKGNQQAEVFASLLDNKPISAIYSTNYQRTLQSAGPLSSALNLPIQKYDPRDPNALIVRVTQNRTDQVIVGHSNTVPDLVSRLGGESQAIAESEYGLVFAVSITVLNDIRVNTNTRKIILLESLPD